MRSPVKRETPHVYLFRYVRFWILSIAGASNGQCPLEASVTDSVHCEGQKILVVFRRFSSEAGLMVEFVIRVNQQRTAYIPKEIVEGLGYDWVMVPDTKAAVIYARQCNLETAIRSVEVILESLRLRLANQQKESKNSGF